MKVARLSSVTAPLESGVEIFLQGTITDTPDVDVDARPILGRLTKGAPTMGSCQAVAQGEVNLWVRG